MKGLPANKRGGRGLARAIVDLAAMAIMAIGTAAGSKSPVKAVDPRLRPAA
jgi:hypothetical protein